VSRPYHSPHPAEGPSSEAALRPHGEGRGPAHHVHWVRVPQELDALSGLLRGARTVSLDTEADSFYHYFEKVCLLQVAGPHGVALVDPLSVRDLAALRSVLADPAVEKVLHGGENDVSLLKRDFGLEFVGLFDTQVAAQFCGRPQTGLAALLEADLGIRHGKELQRCDWSLRPLTPDQERYAADDVRHLPALRDRLLEELRRLGREAWVREEGEALGQTAAASRREAADFRKARGARELGPRGLAILRELFRWREERARRVDRPLFMVIGDRTLVALAERRPRDADGLRKIPGMPSRIVERKAHEILDAIRRGEAVPEPHFPRPPRQPQRPRVAGYVQRLAALKAWRAEASARVRLDAGLILPQRLIDAIAHASPGDLEQMAAVPGIRRWRVETFGGDLLAAIR
jgi:ribonuclease D